MLVIFSNFGAKMGLEIELRDVDKNNFYIPSGC